MFKSNSPTVELDFPRNDHAPAIAEFVPVPLPACGSRTISRTRILIGFAAVYAASLLLLLWIGLRPAIPLSFLPKVVLIGAPVAVCALYVESLLETRGRAVKVLAAGLLAVAILLWYRHYVLYCVLAALFLPYTRAVRWSGSAFKSIGFALVALVIGFGAVWNLNYLVAAASHGRLHDAPLLEFDRWIYSLLSGVPGDAAGMFPLIHSPAAVKVFENAYVVLFPEMVLTVAALGLRSRAGELERFLLAFFASYGIAVVVFLAYPVVGPPIYRPETFSVAFHDSLTRQLMQGMASEYRNAVERTALNGFGYFVAIPSLHVIDAIVLQWYLRKSPVLAYCFLPINIAIALSTVVLGYHYSVDVVAGGGVAALVIRVAEGPRLKLPSIRPEVKHIRVRPHDQIPRP